MLFYSVASIHAQNNDSYQTTAPQHRGDNFSLEGALALFKQAKSVEQFEKMLNKQDNNVNNLDLNNDRKTDYISVNDIKESNAHILVLSTYLSADKSQDIATINIERSGDQQANVQIIGDPDLYPANSVSEPSNYNGNIASGDNNYNQVDNRNNANGQYNSNNNYNDGNRNYQNEVNVQGWPLVQYMYNPYYSVWNSPYYWDYQPYWYRPWRPIGYNTFNIGITRFSPYYRNSPVIRLNYSRNIYAERRGNIGYRQNFHNQNLNVNIRQSQGRSVNINRSMSGRSMSSGRSGGERGHR